MTLIRMLTIPWSTRPDSVAIDKNGCFYVSDEKNNRVLTKSHPQLKKYDICKDIWN